MIIILLDGSEQQILLDVQLDYCYCNTIVFHLTFTKCPTDI